MGTTVSTEDSLCDDPAVATGTSGGLAMSCVRPEGGIKRKLDMRSPYPTTLDTNVTPALRGPVAREGLAPPKGLARPDSQTEGATPFNRLPSKRRLF